MKKTPPLKFNITGTCGKKARCAEMKLRNGLVETPVFMPVGTQGTIKSLLSSQVSKDLGCKIILGNTYHLSQRPGTDVLQKAGGLHKFMNWPNALLTDSGGFQMVSLLKLSDLSEKGVTFQSPHDGTKLLLTPEESMRIQNVIGADIMMALDDVISSLTTGPRVEEAMDRSIRWLDRCIKAHKNVDNQNLFGIIQGGLDTTLRKKCCEEMVKRNLPGYAIGGLSGGEEKDKYWRVVSLCTDFLPSTKPRYCMGVGYAVDIVVSVALGADMFDCVYPCRTARFGTALSSKNGGNVKIKQNIYKFDFSSVTEVECNINDIYTRSFFQKLKMNPPTTSSLLTLHNISYMMDLMKTMREEIKKKTFNQWVIQFFKDYFPNGDYPKWAVDALKTVEIIL